MEVKMGQSRIGIDRSIVAELDQTPGGCARKNQPPRLNHLRRLNLI
jgi:hypothetical protein